MPTETAREIFLDHFFFFKKQLYLPSSCFSNLSNASARLFCTLSFAQSRKILSKFSRLSAICIDDVNCASVAHLLQIVGENQPKCENNLGYYIKVSVFLQYRSARSLKIECKSLNSPRDSVNLSVF